MKTTFIFFFGILLISFSGCNLLPSVEKTYTITALCDSNGTITPSSITAEKGETVKFTIAPFEGCVVKEITVDDKPVTIPNDNILYLSNVSSDHKVKVTIEKSLEYFIINSSCGLNGTISPSGDVSVLKTEGKTFEIVAGTGYFVDSFYVDGVGTKTSSATAGISYKFSSVSSNHAIRATFRVKEYYKILSSASANGVISPLGETNVVEGQTKTFQTTANEFCSLQKYVVDGVDVNPVSSYTFSEINADHTINAVFTKDIEWYLLKITWFRDSVYINGHIYYEPGAEVLNFKSDGTYTSLWNGKIYNRTWSLDKNTSPATISVDYGVCTINVLNEQKMVITSPYSNTMVYHGVPKN